MTEHAKIRLVTQILTVVGLLVVLKFGLLAALIAGFLVYYLVELGANLLERIGIIPATGRVILLILVVLAIVTACSLGIMALMSQLANGPESLVALLQKMADIVDSARTHMPLWLQKYMPADVHEWQAAVSEWLRHNASHFSVFGKEAGKFLAHIIIGMVIGGIVALDSSPANTAVHMMVGGGIANDSGAESHAPLARALVHRVEFLGRAFRNIVFSQVRISAVNTCLTAVYLLLILPAVGYPLPLAKTMVVITFIVGLMPIIGNLISNTVIFLIALSVSPLTAVASLGYLIFIHKLEYFINARIIGARINARSWEILTAMLVMEASFGLPGLIAAPVYYAYLKDELVAQKLI